MVLLGLGIGAAARSQEVRPPVELFSPQPRYPLEAQGSGLRPEVEVSVKLDERGRVAEVEVLRIRPASELDAAFTQAVRAALAEWRYAPRYEDGVPKATTLRWTMTLVDSEVQVGRPSGSSWWQALLGAPPGRRESYFELPREQRERVLAQRVQVGSRFLGAERFVVASPRFMVRTDFSEDAARAIANNLEATYTILASLFGRSIPAEQDRLRVQVFAYSSKVQLDGFSAEFRHDERTPWGFYSHEGLIALTLEASTPQEALSLLLHEATHAYVDRHIARPGVYLPYWLSEGLAEYLANSEIKKGKLIPGKTARSRRNYIRMYQGRVYVLRSKAPRVATLQEIRKAAKQGDSPTLAEILEAEPNEFYGEREALYYGMSWIIVHFLRHGRPEWTDRAFPEFLLFCAEGYRVPAAFEEAYGRSAAVLEAEFRRYLSDF